MKHFSLNNLRLIKWFRRRPFSGAFITGLAFGLTASGLCMVTTDETWPLIPRWTEIVFYPGIYAGVWFYENVTPSQQLAHLCGWLAVGFFYGVLFLLLYILKKILFR